MYCTLYIVYLLPCQIEETVTVKFPVCFKTNLFTKDLGKPSNCTYCMEKVVFSETATQSRLNITDRGFFGKIYIYSLDVVSFTEFLVEDDYCAL
jgi:hypothetical protein